MGLTRNMRGFVRMTIDRLSGIFGAIVVIAGTAYVLFTGQQPPQPWRLFEQDEKAVILVGRNPGLVSACIFT
jgi:hypothetical protein